MESTTTESLTGAEEQEAEYENNYDSFHAATRQHGSLLLVAWCFLIPCSIAGSVFLKSSSQRSSLLYFRFHYIVAAFGMMLAVFGYAIGIRSYDTLFQPPPQRYYHHSQAFLHAILGIVVMWGAVLNTILYLVMGKPPVDLLAFDERPRYKKMARSIHRAMGYVITGLAILTCGIGTRITWVYNDAFLIAFFIVIGASFIITVLLWYHHRRTTTMANNCCESGTEEERQRLVI
jgi:hypothetical protein